MISLFTFVILGYLFLSHAIAFIVMIFQLTWKIPVVILRYAGDKNRPVLIVRKARKTMQGGVPKLKVRGYKQVINDYKSHNYYPTARGGFGGLILWEYEDGLLTPAIPHKERKNLNDEEKKALAEAERLITKSTAVGFEFDDKLYEHLRLKAVDDVDIESMVYEAQRINKQYSPGWANFLREYGWMFGWILMGIIILVSVVMFFNNAPDIARACSQAAVSSAEDIARAVSSVIETNGGTPPG